MRRRRSGRVARRGVTSAACWRPRKASSGSLGTYTALVTRRLRRARRLNRDDPHPPLTTWRQEWLLSPPPIDDDTGGRSAGAGGAAAVSVLAPPPGHAAAVAAAFSDFYCSVWACVGRGRDRRGHRGLRLRGSSSCCCCCTVCSPSACSVKSRSLSSARISLQPVVKCSGLRRGPPGPLQEIPAESDMNC